MVPVHHTERLSRTPLTSPAKALPCPEPLCPTLEPWPTPAGASEPPNVQGLGSGCLVAIQLTSIYVCTPIVYVCVFVF